MRLCRFLLLLGLAASGLSMYDTLSHAWDPSFEAPALSLGSRHTNYHAFREFTLSVGVAVVLIWGMSRPAGKRTRELWVAMLMATLGYYLGRWPPWPLLGLHVPDRIDEGIHLSATALTPASVVMAGAWFRDRGGRPRGGIHVQRRGHPSHSQGQWGQTPLRNRRVRRARRPAPRVAPDLA